MIRNKIFAIALVGAVTATGAGVLYAQTQDGSVGMMGGMMSMMADCPMTAGMAKGPGVALRHGSEIGLSTEQTEQIEAIHKASAEMHRSAMAQMKAVHAEIRAAADGERFDEAAARAAYRRMGEMHADVGVAMLRARHETRAVLTPEQREKLASLRPEGMMGGMGMGMMKDCPMVKGGMMGGSSRGHHGHMDHRTEGR